MTPLQDRFPMIKSLGLAALILATTTGSVAAQDPEPVAAGRIQNTFDASGRPAVVQRALPAAAGIDLRAEPAIRAIVGGLQTGSLDYGLFTQSLGDQLRVQETAAAGLITSLGTLETIEYLDTQNGAGLFLVRFAEADTQWIVGLDDLGKVAVLLFRPAPPIPADPADATGD
jgi:hypothetical protein